MAEKRSNPFADHPVLNQTILLISFITGNIAIFDKTNLVFMLAAGCLVFAYMNMRVPKKYNPNAYEFRPTLNGILLSLIACSCLAYGSYKLISERSKESAQANIKIDEVLVSSNCVPANHKTLWPYTVRRGHCLPWRLACDSNINSWKNRPSSFPEFQLVEYRDLPEKSLDDYFENCSKFASMYDASCMAFTLDSNNASSLSKIPVDDDCYDSFIFDISLDDNRDITSWIDSLNITVHNFYSYPPPLYIQVPVAAHTQGFYRDESAQLYVPIKKLERSLPWKFDTSHSVTKSAQVIPALFELDKPQVRNKTIRTIDVKILPLEPGLYVYSASIVIKDSKGNERTHPLITKENARALLVRGYANPLIRGPNVTDVNKYGEEKRKKFYDNKEEIPKTSPSLPDGNNMVPPPAPRRPKTLEDQFPV